MPFRYPRPFQPFLNYPAGILTQVQILTFTRLVDLRKLDPKRVVLKVVYTELGEFRAFRNAKPPDMTRRMVELRTPRRVPSAS